uniref:Hsp70 family protein n=1 Tax=Thalassolituus sp. TaxID=2030822 RepID=UPI003511B5AF
MAHIGIDLGTTNSLAAVWKDGETVLIPNIHGEFLTPSVVSVDDDNNILIGKTAKERLVSHPKCTIACFKRLMGTSEQASLNGMTFSPEELSSRVLRQLKDDAEAFLGESV